MKVLLKEVGKQYTFAEVEQTTEAVWELMGGNFETLNLRGGLMLLRRVGEKLAANSVVRASKGATVIDGPFIVGKNIFNKLTGFENGETSIIHANTVAATFSLHEFDNGA